MTLSPATGADNENASHLRLAAHAGEQALVGLIVLVATLCVGAIAAYLLFFDAASF